MVLDVERSASAKDEGFGKGGRLTLNPRRGRSVTHRGTDRDDALVGTPGDDAIAGGRGDDVIDGRGGYDAASGGAGDDLFVLSDGQFLRIDSGAGHDIVSVEGETTFDLVSTGTRVRAIEEVDLTPGRP